MDITIHTTVLPHDDPDASVNFYRDTLGFEVRSDVGKGKMRWSIYETGTVSACQPGKLVVIYDGESYSFDTPMPGCVKP